MTAVELPALEEHVRSSFPRHRVSEASVDPQIGQRLDPFRVLELAPDEGPLWFYVSLGASAVEGRHGERIEFLLATQGQRAEGPGRVTMSAWYHASPDAGKRLALGDTVPIGEPWLDDSPCDHYLVSRPYPFDPGLEVFDSGTAHVHFLWLLPITAAEREFKAEHGADALEERFERASVEYWRPDRPSLV